MCHGIFAFALPSSRWICEIFLGGKLSVADDSALKRTPSRHKLRACITTRVKFDAYGVGAGLGSAGLEQGGVVSKAGVAPEHAV